MNLSFQDKNYWEEYYSHADRIPETPSPFAMFLANDGLIVNSSIIELGCGNGRDAKFFTKTAKSVIAVDQCINTTSMLDKLDGISSYPADFTNLAAVDDADKLDVVYSRFTIHAVDVDGENRTLTWILKNLKPGGLFCCEVRTTKDNLWGKGVDKGGNVWYYNSHHRRFVVSEEFVSKVKEYGFEIKSAKEDKGFAPYKTEDPIVLRIIARKPSA